MRWRGWFHRAPISIPTTSSWRRSTALRSRRGTWWRPSGICHRLQTPHRLAQRTHCSLRVAGIASEPVSTVYIDTSALGRILLDEPDKPAIEEALDTFDQITASRLLRIELRRVGTKRGLLDRADA